jgi:hypothetical protein
VSVPVPVTVPVGTASHSHLNYAPHNTGWKPMLLWAPATLRSGRQEGSIGILPVGPVAHRHLLLLLNS